MRVTLATLSLQRNLPEMLRERERGGLWEGLDNMGHGCLQQASIIAVVSSEGSGVGSRAHQEEGAQGCLFLMVASEHSASDVSQSESPKCSGF